MPLDSCTHTEPRCETEERCADRERFKRNCESIQFASVVPAVVAARRKDQQFAKDAAAYRRLRKDGVQPKFINGSAMAEKMATHPIEIEIGRDLHPIEKKALARTTGAL